MKFRDRHSSKNPVKAYGFDSKKKYKKFPPLTLKQRYKNEVFGAFKNPGMMAKAKAVYALMKNYPNLKMYKELDLFQRIGFNKSYKEAEPRNRAPFSGTTVNTSRHHFPVKVKGAKTPTPKKVKLELSTGLKKLTSEQLKQLKIKGAELRRLEVDGISVTPKNKKRVSKPSVRVKN